jgi:hypothetical protein
MGKWVQDLTSGIYAIGILLLLVIVLAYCVVWICDNTYLDERIWMIFGRFFSLPDRFRKW